MGSKELLERHHEVRQQVDDVRLASFLTRASISASAVCDAHKQGVIGEALDKVKAQREHWINQVKELV